MSENQSPPAAADLAAAPNLVPFPVADPARLKLFVAVPCYGAIDPYFALGLLDLFTEPPCSLSLALQVGDSLVSRARNSLVHRFLQGDCTHLLFLDSDLIFSPKHVGRLVGHAARGHQVLAGLYPKKQAELRWVLNTRPEFGTADPETKLQRVMYAGTGMLMVAREVFTGMIAEGIVQAYKPDAGETAETRHDFFPVGVHDASGRYLSEDWWFCENCQSLGVPVEVDTSVICKHVGTAIYPLVPPDQPEGTKPEGLREGF